MDAPGVASGGMGADAIAPDVDAIALGAAELAGALADGFVGPDGADACAGLALDDAGADAGAGGVNGTGDVAVDGGFATRAGDVRSSG